MAWYVKCCSEVKEQHFVLRGSWEDPLPVIWGFRNGTNFDNESSVIFPLKYVAVRRMIACTLFCHMYLFSLISQYFYQIHSVVCIKLAYRLSDISIHFLIFKIREIQPFWCKFQDLTDTQTQQCYFPAIFVIVLYKQMIACTFFCQFYCSDR